ncbi:MAG: hypothetical protein R3C53_13815 [Pirellulaceae bacterium]
MNYLAHAYRYLDRPYFAAGTALPDWMSVIDRKNRARRQFAEPVADDDDPEIAAFARGVMRHHDDDRWFHSSQPFVQLSTKFAVELRERLAKGMGHQAGFVGHIAVELLLDAALIQRHPELLREYYQTLEDLDHHKLQTAANKICRKPISQLVVLVPRFIQERFLADYPNDSLLLNRLNGVMRRVGLPPLPENITPWLAEARPQVSDAADELLQEPTIPKS